MFSSVLFLLKTEGRGDLFVPITTTMETVVSNHHGIHRQEQEAGSDHAKVGPTILRSVISTTCSVLSDTRLAFTFIAKRIGE